MSQYEPTVQKVITLFSGYGFQTIKWMNILKPVAAPTTQRTQLQIRWEGVNFFLLLNTEYGRCINA